MPVGKHPDGEKNNAWIPGEHFGVFFEHVLSHGRRFLSDGDIDTLVHVEQTQVSAQLETSIGLVLR